MARATSKRTLSLLVSFLMLVGAFYVYGSLLKPEYESINQLRGQLVAKQDFFNQQKQILDNIRDVLTKYQGVAALQDTVSLALPNEQQIPALFAQTSAIARATGITLNSMSLTARPPRDNQPTLGSAQEFPVIRIGTIKVDLNLSGSYEAFKNFMRTIETNIRIMDVEQFDIAPSKTREADQFSVTLNTYYQE
jgi:Tfp pilus assembly protein PilO